MIKIKMKMTGDLPDKEHDACKILEYINDVEDLVVLNSHHWDKREAKVDFLMGKTSYINAIIAEPLSKEDAEQATTEYYKLMGINK
jgi:hypothetical protein